MALFFTFFHFFSLFRHFSATFSTFRGYPWVSVRVSCGFRSGNREFPIPGGGIPCSGVNSGQEFPDPGGFRSGNRGILDSWGGIPGSGGKIPGGNFRIRAVSRQETVVQICHRNLPPKSVTEIWNPAFETAKHSEGLNFSAETLPEILSLPEILGKNFWHNKTSGKVSVRKVWPPHENFWGKYFRTKSGIL